MGKKGKERRRERGTKGSFLYAKVALTRWFKRGFTISSSDCKSPPFCRFRCYKILVEKITPRFINHHTERGEGRGWIFKGELNWNVRKKNNKITRWSWMINWRKACCHLLLLLLLPVRFSSDAHTHVQLVSFTIRLSPKWEEQRIKDAWRKEKGKIREVSECVEGRKEAEVATTTMRRLLEHFLLYKLLKVTPCVCVCVRVLVWPVGRWARKKTASRPGDDCFDSLNYCASHFHMCESWLN